MPNAEIARLAGVSRPTVITWRERYESGGIPALEDARRSGRPAEIDEVEVVARSWRTTVSSAAAGDHALVGSVPGLRAGHLVRDRRPGLAQVGDPAAPARDVQTQHRPAAGGKIRDVVGLYLAPPDNAVVVSVDEKSQIQALDRTAPMLPLRPGLAERRTYKRNGTTILFAALEVATGKITADACYARHRHQEFLKKVAAARPGVELHVVLDNYATHKDPEIRSWLHRQPAGHPALARPAAPAQHGRILLRHHHPPGHPPRHLPQRQRPHQRHRPVHRRLQPALPAIHLDKRPRPTHRQNQTVKELVPRDTRIKGFAIMAAGAGGTVQ